MLSGAVLYLREKEKEENWVTESDSLVALDKTNAELTNGINRDIGPIIFNFWFRSNGRPAGTKGTPSINLLSRLRKIRNSQRA